MFNIGLAEFLMIAIAALVLLGPDNLPSALRSLARVIRDFRRMGSQLRDQLDPEFHEVTSELRDALDGRDPLPRIEPPVLPAELDQSKHLPAQGAGDPPGGRGGVLPLVELPGGPPPAVEPGALPAPEPPTNQPGRPIPRASSGSGEHGT